MNTIAITFPEVKVNAQVQGLTFDTLENMIFDITQTIACKVFEKALTDIDDNLRNKRNRGILKTPVKGKSTFLPVSGISATPVPVTGTRQVKVIIFWMRP